MSMLWSTVSSVTGFFYDDPTMSYVPLIANKQEYYFCRLHPEIKNIHLESIEHHIKYKDPEAHKSELLKSPKLTHG